MSVPKLKVSKENSATTLGSARDFLTPRSSKLREERNAAAVTLQSVARGVLARKSVKRLKLTKTIIFLMSMQERCAGRAAQRRPAARGA